MSPSGPRWWPTPRSRRCEQAKVRRTAAHHRRRPRIIAASVVVHPYSRCQTAVFVPAARSRPGFVYFHPDEGWRSADRRPGAAAPGGPPRHTRNERIMRAPLCHAAGRGACEAPRVPQSRRDARLSALHRGDFGPGPRFHLGHFLPIRTASSSQPGRSAWRAGSPSLPRPAVTSRGRGTPLLAPPSGSSPEDAPHRARIDAIRSYIACGTQVTTS